MDAQPSSTVALPSAWATPMLVAGNGQQTIVYASFVSATVISSSTRQEVFEISCAPSQCDGTAFPKQTITQAFEVYVCPSDNGYCPEEESEDSDAEPTTYFGYPLGYSGQATADGTTTEWGLALSVLKDNERSSGATQDDTMTYMATTKVGKDVKASTSTVMPMNEENACIVYDNYAFVSVTAGVEDMLKDYPSYIFPNELEADDFVPAFVSQRQICAKMTSGSPKGASETGSNGSGPKETGSSENSDDSNDDDDNASGKMSLSFALMGALLAVSVLIP
jgi:hypothetical protein